MRNKILAKYNKWMNRPVKPLLLIMMTSILLTIIAIVLHCRYSIEIMWFLPVIEFPPVYALFILFSGKFFEEGVF